MFASAYTIKAKLSSSGPYSTSLVLARFGLEPLDAPEKKHYVQPFPSHDSLIVEGRSTRSDTPYTVVERAFAPGQVYQYHVRVGAPRQVFEGWPFRVALEGANHAPVNVLMHLSTRP